jgi:phage tail-like protein
MKAVGALGVASAFSGVASADRQGNGELIAQQRPLGNSRFIVEIDGLDVSGFSRVEMPVATISNSEYRDGNELPHDRQLWGQTDYEALVLERAVVGGENLQLWEWFLQARQGKLAEAKSAIAVQLLDRQGQPQARYEFTEAWPKEYTPPTLDANDPRTVATESLTIVYEEFERTA